MTGSTCPSRADGAWLRSWPPHNTPHTSTVYALRRRPARTPGHDRTMSPRQAIWLALHWLTITTGLIVLALFGFLTSMGHMGMRTVFPTAPVYGLVTQRLYDPAHLWRHIGLIGLGVLLVAGLPCVRRPSSGAPEGSSRVFGGIALAAAATFGVAFANIFYFTDSTDVCVRAGCWPLPAQSAAAILPALLTAAAMVTLAVRWRQTPWWVRWIAPPLRCCGSDLQVSRWPPGTMSCCHTS